MKTQYLKLKGKNRIRKLRKQPLLNRKTKLALLENAPMILIAVLAAYFVLKTIL